MFIPRAITTITSGEKMSVSYLMYYLHLACHIYLLLGSINIFSLDINAKLEHNGTQKNTPRLVMAVIFFNSFIDVSS